MFDSSARAREVLTDTDRIVAQDRKLTLRLLKNLHEIERDKLYLFLAYSSMFDYCTRHLRYSEPSALRRIRAARCLARYPQLLPLLESGDVNPTTVSMIAKHIRPDNAGAVINAIKCKSTRDVERFIAALQPLSAIPPDRVRPVVVPVVSCAKSTSSADGKKLSSVDELTAIDRRAGDPEKSAAATVVTELQFERRARVEFTAHEELMDKLERIRSIASHRLPANASFEQLLDFMAGYFLEREDPAKREMRRELRAAKQQGIGEKLAPTGNPRQMPARTRDQVFVRDQKCMYKGPDGKRCGSIHVLQVDHIKPVARGGASTIDNLRVLCAYHNRLESERLMGRRGPRVGLRE
jgi:5-methylcytosine-specific restriction endonuclease McrA